MKHAYIATIHERGNDPRSEKTRKKYLKTRLQQEIEGMEFEKSVQRNTSEKIYSQFASDTILDAAITKILENKEGNFKTISNAAKIIRAACLQHIRTTDTSYNCTERPTCVPIEVSSMMRWILAGAGYLYSKRKSAIEENAISLSNTILFSIKTDRQVGYQSTDPDKVVFKGRYENSHVVGMGLTVRQFGRRKGSVNMLHNFGYSISNRRCISVETSLTNEVIKNSVENGFYLPENAKKSNIIMYHLDNTDFLEDTIDGKNTTHALLLVGAQYPTSNEPFQVIPPVKISGCTKLLPDSFGDLEYCKKPLDRDFKRSLSIG